LQVPPPYKKAFEFSSSGLQHLLMKLVYREGDYVLIAAEAIMRTADPDNLINLFLQSLVRYFNTPASGSHV
jgi:hypothetical protein